MEDKYHLHGGILVLKIIQPSATLILDLKGDNMRESEIDFLTNFLVESDAIEGIDNDFNQVRKEFERDVYEPSPFIGHIGAIRMLKKMAIRGNLLDEDTIKRVQQLIVEEQVQKGERQLPSDQIGQWRKHEVWIVRCNSHGEVLSHKPIGAKHEEIPEKISELINGVVEWQKFGEGRETEEEIIRFIAQFHYKYERIHPFADGNGRSGRALVYFLYKYWHLTPFVFTNADKHISYYPCFAQGNPQAMEKYFLNRSLATE